MGNKPAIPAKEAIYQAAKNGRVTDLRGILRNVPADARPASFLEWEDADGRTALIVAASKGHADCVELLLRHRANVQHMSLRLNEGGTALHEAVFRQVNRRIVDLLLRYGASPFVENRSNFTPLDYAIVKRDAQIIRRFEKHGYFAYYLQVRVRKIFGFSKGWSPKWVTIIPRYGCPLLQRDRQIMRRMMLVYPDAQSYEPFCKVYLDGANARQVIGHTGQTEALVALHPSHAPPKGVQVSRDQTSGYMMHFMNYGQDLTRLENFILGVNMVYPLPVQPVTDQTAAHASPVSDLTAVESSEAPPQDDQNAASVPSLPSMNSRSVEPEQSAPLEGSLETNDDESTLASAPPLPPDFDANDDEEGVDRNSAPTFEPLGQDSMVLDDENLCVVCLSQPRNVGFVHGSSIHRCVCQDCAKTLQKAGDELCPICRQKIEHVITSFY